MEEITARRALELLIDVVDAYGPQTVYERIEVEADDLLTGPETLFQCRYEHNGAPSCLVGHVLHRAGMSVAELALLDAVGIGASNLTKWGPTLHISGNAAALLGVAQRAQDNDVPWGQAVDQARATYERGLRDERDADR